ncbi:MAG: helix-turn-helix transcriptional regulator [Candidatus Eremiobacteraeota bacterium]|nr:helix-turn-helix transcriptional regulator [Candidatus Eremiobacteraeota bacterium]
MLSRREREVAELVAAGHTNRLVAERLGIGEKTVEKHIGSIYAKLGFRSRATLAAYVGATRKHAGRVSPHIGAAHSAVSLAFRSSR